MARLGEIFLCVGEVQVERRRKKNTLLNDKLFLVCAN